MKTLNNLKQYHKIQQFYYYEARLLDQRQFQQWMNLLGPDIQYSMPNRANSGTDITLKNTDEILNLQQELSSGFEPPLRDDDFMSLTFRANRPSSAMAIADNPLMRTIRQVNNIEVYKLGSKKYQTYNNVSMSYSRYSMDNYHYHFMRRDVLQQIKGQIKLLKREIIVDWNVIDAPTVAMIL